MAGGFNNINFKINFQAGDKSAFAKLKKELTEMKQLAQSVDFGLDQNSANKVISTADSIARAMTKAYDPQLNTVNIQKFNNLLKQSGTDIKQVQQNLSTMGASGSNAFMKMTAQLMEINPAIKQTNAFLDDLYKTLFNTIKYTVFNNLLSSISSTIKQSYYYVKDLDTSLNDIRIVTGKSADEMERFAVQANDAAKTLAVSTKAYTEGSLIYYQQGLDDETVKALTDITAKTSNVTGQSMSSVSEQLTAVQNGYRVANEAAEEGMQVYERYVDKMAAVGATTASNLEELSTAMSKVASAASAMGVDFDDLNAQIATIVSVTRQAPESVGTALKTIYARLGDLKVDGVDEFGTKLGEVSSNLKVMGIDIINPLTGDMRDMSSVMAEVAEKWNTQTSAQKQAAAVAMAGKRQYNNLIALFDNQDMYSEALETSMNSAGTLEKQQEIALESLNKKITVLKTTAEDLYDSLFDTKTIGGFVEAGTNLIQILANFVDGVGGLNNILPLVVFNLTQLFSKQIAAGAESIITNLKRSSEAAALAEQNMRELELVFANSSFQSGKGAEGRMGAAYEQGMGQLQNLYQQVGQYQSIMNEQEKQNYDLLKQQQMEVNEKRNALADMLKTLEGMHNEYGFITKDTLQNVENTELQLKDTDTLDKVIKKLEENLTRMDMAKKAKTQDSFQFKDGSKNFGGITTGNGVPNMMTSLQEEFNLTQDQQTLLKNAINDTNFDTAQSSLKSLIESLKETSKRAHEVGQSSIDIETAQSRISNFAKAMSEQLNLRSLAADITLTIGAIGKLGFAINTIKSMGNVLNDDSIDGMTKFSQIAMNLGFTISNLKGIVGPLAKTFTDLGSTIAGLGQNLNNSAQLFKLTTELADKQRIATEAQTAAENANKAATAARTQATELSALAEEKVIAAKNARKGLVPGEIANVQKSIAAHEAEIAVMDEEEAKNLIYSRTAGKNGKHRKQITEYIYQEIMARHTATAAVEAEATANAAESAAITAQSEATVANTEVTEINTEIQELNNQKLLAKKAIIFGTIGAIVAIGAAIVTASFLIKNAELKRAEAARQAREEQQKAYEEQREQTRKEIEDKQKLAQSYIDLYSLYEKHKASKEDMAQKTEELVEILGEERVAVATLTGDYESLNEEVLEYRKNQIQEKFRQNTEDIKTNKNNLSQLYNKTVMQDINPAVEKLLEEDEVLGRIFSVDENRGVVFTLDPNDKEAMDRLPSAITQLSSVINQSGDIFRSTESSQLRDFQTSALPYYTNIQDIQADNELVGVQNDVISNFDLANVEDYSEFTKIVQFAYDRLKTDTSDSVETMKEAINLVADLSGSNAEQVTRARATTTLIQKYGEQVGNINIQKFADSLSQEDLQVLLSGKIVIDEDKTEEQIKEQIKVIQNNMQPEDLSIAVSLREKLASDKNSKGKLTKKQVEEARQEAGALGLDYEAEFSDFENQSQLKQVETLNNVVQDKIEINKAYLENVKQNSQEELEIYDEVKEQYRKLLDKKEQAENQGGVVQTEKDQEEFEIAQKNQKAIEEHYKELENIVDGLDFSYVDDTIFDNLVAGMDGVISEAQVLKSLAEDIGEDQVIAAEDIERFGKNFPEIIEAEENFKFLQDGSLQLTKEGQAVLQETLGDYKAKLLAENEGYKIQLQKQADIQKASAEYYKEQADNLRAYLNGQKTGAEAEADMAKSLEDYKNDLKEKTGMNDEELNRVIQENLGNTTDIAQADTQQIYDYWVGIGKAAEAASIAYEYQHFEDPNLRPGGGGGVGTNVTSYNRKDTGNEVQISKLEDAQIEQMIIDLDKAAEVAENRYSDYMSKIRGLGGTTGAAINAMDRAASGKGGKESKSKSGSSKKDKDKEEKEQEDEFDRYWEIKKAIDAVDQALKKLDKDKQNLYGYELIDALRQENELLEQQAANYNTLYEMQQQEAAELREQLGTMGLMFDASGAITNYAAATSAALAQYSAAIEQYNAGLIDETTLKVYEKAYENFKKLLERYDKLYYTEMQQTQEKLDEIRRKELANNLKAWEVEIQIHLDKEKMKRDWNDFLKEIKQDFRKVFSDLTIDVKYDRENFKSLVNDVYTTTKAISDVEAEIDKMMSGGSSDMFESVSQAQEKLKELQDQLLDQGKALQALYKQVWESYLNGIDQVKDQFDELMDRYQKFNDELEFHAKLIELLYGDKAYDLMDKYYQTQTKNIEAQISSLRKQTEFWQNEFQKSYESAIKSGSQVDMNDFTTQTEDMKKAYDYMNEAQEKLNDSILDAVDILQKKYLNTINKIVDEMDKGLFGPGGYDEVKSNQEFLQKMADEYLDDYEKAARVQTFANKIDMDKANASNLKAQQKIQAFRDKEIAALREEKNLTEDQVKLAEARYDIMLKEIALEDAQNNKTSMKLTRNEQGNWSYQYVADEDDTAQKQQDLLQAYADLYKMADDAFAHSTELAFEIEEEFKEKALEIATDMSLNEEQKNQKLQELRDKYYQQMMVAAEKASKYEQEMMQAGAGVLVEVCRQDEENYNQLTEEEKRLVTSVKETTISNYNELRQALIDEFYPDLDKVIKQSNMNSQSFAADVIKQWVTNPDSVQKQMNKAIASMQKAIQDYEQELTVLQEKAGMDFSQIGQYIDNVSEKIDNMEGTTERMVDNSSNYLDELRRALDAIAEAWNSVIKQILDAQDQMKRYIDLAGQARAANQATTGNTGGGNTGGIGPGSNGNTGGDDTTDKPEDNGNTGPRFKIMAQDGHHNVDTRIDSAGEKGLTLEEAHTLYTNNKVRWGTEGLSNFRFQNMDNNSGFPAYKTGGYTGQQNGSNGQLAMLHQKELVLNADDTENFLSGISIIRDMVNLNGSIADAITTAVANMVLTFGRTAIGTGFTTGGSSSESNIYNITAEFPNANDVNEIREAILSLPNLASQYVAQNKI